MNGAADSAGHLAARRASQSRGRPNTTWTLPSSPTRRSRTTPRSTRVTGSSGSSTRATARRTASSANDFIGPALARRHQLRNEGIEQFRVHRSSWVARRRRRAQSASPRELPRQFPPPQGNGANAPPTRHALCDRTLRQMTMAGLRTRHIRRAARLPRAAATLRLSLDRDRACSPSAPSAERAAVARQPGRCWRRGGSGPPSGSCPPTATSRRARGSDRASRLLASRPAAAPANAWDTRILERPPEHKRVASRFVESEKAQERRGVRKLFLCDRADSQRLLQVDVVDDPARKQVTVQKMVLSRQDKLGKDVRWGGQSTHLGTGRTEPASSRSRRRRPGPVGKR